MENNNLVPTVDPKYIAWGNFDKVKRVIESGNFYPLWITGPTGNGKTKMIEQACATSGRKLVRVNFTQETGEDDLFGGFRLKNGDTVWEDGPIVTALKEGAIVLLDEIDAANTNRVLSLQGVLEGNGVHLKQIDQRILPAKGFNVIATSNTKGQGSDDGRYLGTSIMNAAFLDRFAGMLVQTYPEERIEAEILKKYYGAYVQDNVEYCAKIEKMSEAEQKNYFKNESVEWLKNLCLWAKEVRKNFADNVVNEVITTRTLINVVQAYVVFKDKRMAVEMACERFPLPIKESFIQYYTKLVPEAENDLTN